MRRRLIERGGRDGGDEDRRWRWTGIEALKEEGMMK